MTESLIDGKCTRETELAFFWKWDNTLYTYDIDDGDEISVYKFYALRCGRTIVNIFHSDINFEVFRCAGIGGQVDRIAVRNVYPSPIIAYFILHFISNAR